MLAAAQNQEQKQTQRRIMDLEWQVNYALIQLKKTRGQSGMTVQPLADMKSRAESELARLRA